MDGRNLEPRFVMWAVAEVVWENNGKPSRVPGTLEDTSRSGACIRVKTPITVGSRLTVRWHREQFSGVAQNCRSDGREFLLGVRREAAPSTPPASLPPKPDHSPEAAPQVKAAPADVAPKEIVPPPAKSASPPARQAAKPNTSASPAAPVRALTAASARTATKIDRKNDSRSSTDRPTNRPTNRPIDPVQRVPSENEGTSARQERKVMPPKRFFPKFWQRQQDGTDAPDEAARTEAPLNKSQTSPAEGLIGPHHDLLSYEDIYHAAGILSARSGYGVHKVVDMLNSDRIRDLSNDVKRASVLMALDAAGTSADDLLQDATRRQQALNSYEAGQQKQLEEFEARKAQENVKIQAEMDKVTAHYAERVQQNQDQVVSEKEALRSWQMAKQCESQRIAEVIELCSKRPASPPASDSQPALSTASDSAGPAVNPTRPNLVAKASAGH